MYKVMRCWIFIVIACFFFVGSLDFAEGKYKDQGDRPPGWDKGEKRGWNSDIPPGLEKKEAKEKLKKERFNPQNRTFQSHFDTVNVMR